jgi:hypothetical protein
VNLMTLKYEDRNAVPIVNKGSLEILQNSQFTHTIPLYIRIKYAWHGKCYSSICMKIPDIKLLLSKIPNSAAILVLAKANKIAGLV